MRDRVEEINCGQEIQAADFKGNGWGRRHANEWCEPKSKHARAVKQMLVALADYADANKEQFDSDIGTDGVLGEAWRNGVLAVRALLDGHNGALDCGVLWQTTEEMLRIANARRE
jgi:hypothetical protein